MLDGAWLVGSGCGWFLRPESPGEPWPRDFDLLVDPPALMRACAVVGPRQVRLNQHGGVKVLAVTGQHPEVDVIPVELSWFVTNATGDAAVRVNPLKVVRW